MFSGYLQDFSRMFSRCSDGSCGPGGFWRSMKVCTLMVQRNLMIPSYLIIPCIRCSPAIWWSPAIRWSIESMDFDNPKVYGDTSITDGLVYWLTLFCMLRFPIYIERWISEKPSLRLLLQLTHRRISVNDNQTQPQKFIWIKMSLKTALGPLEFDLCAKNECSVWMHLNIMLRTLSTN